MCGRMSRVLFYKPAMAFAPRLKEDKMFEKLKRLLSLFFKGNSLDYICGTEALPMPFSQ